MTELEQLESICGSKDRASVMLATVRVLMRDDEQRLTPAAVDAKCDTLFGWTATGDDEIAVALAVIEAEGDARIAQIEGAEPAAEQPTEQVSVEPPVDFGDRDTALARVNLLTRELGDARSAFTAAGNRLRTLRAAAASAIECWQRGLPRSTFRQALMEVAATQRATKQEVMDGTVPGPSAWDRQAYYSTGRGSAPAFVQKRMRGGGNRRGSLPLNAARGPMDTAGKSKTPLRRTITS